LKSQKSEEHFRFHPETRYQREGKHSERKEAVNNKFVKSLRPISSIRLPIPTTDGAVKVAGAILRSSIFLKKI
jgi:hypothetical protein